MVYFDTRNNLIMTEKLTESPDLFDKEKIKKPKKDRGAR